MYELTNCEEREETEVERVGVRWPHAHATPMRTPRTCTHTLCLCTRCAYARAWKEKDFRMSEFSWSDSMRWFSHAVSRRATAR